MSKFRLVDGASIVLASQSPRRSELLNEIGLSFTVCPSAFIEQSEIKDPVIRANTFAKEKSLEVAKKFPDSYVIGADTVVSCKNQILEKPVDINDAKRMIRLLSNAEHQVYGAVTIVLPKSLNTFDQERTVSFIEVSTVTFRDIPDKAIDTYLSSADYLDKAGAYGIQEDATVFVKKIDGSYTNIVGLDIVRLSEELLALNVIQWA